MRFIKSVVAISIVLGLSGCGGSGYSPEKNTNQTNTPPTVTAEFPEQTINAGQQTVTLAVNASDNGSVVSYRWFQTSGIAVNLSGADSATATFETPMVTYDDGAQVLTFTVTVTDDQNAQTTSTLSVTIEPNNHTPTLTIAGPQSVTSKDTVSFAASANDTDGTIVSYQWQQLSGIELAFDALDQATISAVAPAVTTAQTVALQLTVSDDKGATTTSNVEFQINPIPLTLSADTLVRANSGGFAKLNWQVTSGDEQLTYRLVRDDTNETLSWLSTESNRGTFNAPVAFDGDLSVPLTLTVENALGQMQSQALTLKVQAADNLFAAKKSLLKLTNTGITMKDAYLHDLDADGEPDLIVVSATGTRWYKNKGNFDFDFSNGQWVSSYNGQRTSFSSHYLNILDLDGDNDLDFVSGDNSGLYFRENNGQGEFSPTKKLVDIPASKLDYDKRLLTTFSALGKHYILINDNGGIYHSDGKLYLYEFNGAQATLVSQQSFNSHRVMDTTTSTCDLNNQGQPDIYFRTQYVRAGAGDRATNLYRLSYVDNYQSAQLLNSDDARRIDMICVSAKGEPDRLLQYIDDEGYPDQTTEIRLVDGQYETTQTSFELGDFNSLESHWQVMDVNGDDKDDIVKSTGGIAFLRSDSSNLDFSFHTIIGSLSKSNGKVYRKRVIDSDIFISDKHIFDDDFPVKISVPKDVKISKLQALGEQLLITQSTNGKFERIPMKLNSDGILAENDAVDISPFDASHRFFSADHNGDGQLDVFYQYDFDDGSYRGRTAIAVAVAVAVAVAQNGGFIEPEVLLTYEKQQTGSYFSRLEDVDGDGHFDFTLANNEVVYFEQWFLYNSDSQSYEEELDNSLYGVDIDNNYQESSIKRFGDFDGDGDKDILRIGEFRRDCDGWAEDCGFVQVAQQTQPRQYAQWQNVIESKMFINSLSIADIDQDGLDDILFSGIPSSNGNDPFPPTWHKWYKWTADGQFEGNDMNIVPYTYTQLFADTPPYFVSINTTEGEVGLYQFNQEFKRPVIEQTVPIDKADMPNILFDLDKDGDLDILLYQDYEVFWIENLGR